MALMLKSEKFEIFDVSEIEVKGKLAFERSDETIIPRNEDEAFIREFIAERGYGKIGSVKICQWPNLKDWIFIVWGVHEMQRQYWVRSEFLNGKIEPPDCIEPDREKDQVTENESYFIGLPTERYAEETCYKRASSEQNDGWMSSNPNLENCLSLSGVKRIDDFIDIYTDFSKMNGCWIGPRESCGISVAATEQFDDIKDEDDYTQSVEKIEVKASYDGTATIDSDGDIHANADVRAEYTDANGNERTMSFSEGLIWMETLREKQIKDGKEEGENGAVKQKYKTVRMSRKRTVDLELWSDAKFEGSEGNERKWRMVSGIVVIYITVVYRSVSDTSETEEKRKQLVVKTKTEGGKQIIGDDVREIVKANLPKPKNGGEMTRLTVNVGEVGWMADIEWNTRIEDDNNV